MAARLNRRHSETVRLKIQASVLVERLHRVSDGSLSMTAQQLKATEILLDRSVPKLQNIQHSGDENNPLNVVQKVVLEIVDPSA